MERKHRASKSSPPAAVSGELGERNELRERSRKRSRLRSRQGRVTTNRTRRVETKPSIDAHEMKRMAAIRHHPQHLRLPILTETDGASSLSLSLSLGLLSRGRKLKLGIRCNNDRIKPNRGSRGQHCIIPPFFLVILWYKDDARKNDASERIRFG
ncbi:hypothetical protein IEQ34_006819 [Dendrobium chrysotoxum]|uniref:Uncharacterized protein n=1 Tax=Dendrobium chrysotoxum TaxID=161865 RepID=A0AAV7H905_DENCH|nr:hypothetical protein IEQ34_006819 [Dendrobium chrysotoxum]